LSGIVYETLTLLKLAPIYPFCVYIPFPDVPVWNNHLCPPIPVPISVDIKYAHPDIVNALSSNVAVESEYSNPYAEPLVDPTVIYALFETPPVVLNTFKDPVVIVGVLDPVLLTPLALFSKYSTGLSWATLAEYRDIKIGCG